MLITEFVLSQNGGDCGEISILGHRVPTWLWCSYCVIGVFLFGAACSQLVTDIMKYTIGRLRPHFYELCRPSVDCGLAQNQHVYHINYTCTNPVALGSKRLMKEMKSVPNLVGSGE